MVVNYTGDLIIQNDAADKDITLKSDDGSGGMTTYLNIDGSEEQIFAYRRFNVFNAGGNNQISLFTENDTSAIGDTFAGNTSKSYIQFSAGTDSNDPGFILHETRGSEANEGVLHLCPSDDNDDNDYISIHGTNDADSLKLATSGKISGVSTIVMDDGSAGSPSITFDGDSNSGMFRVSSDVVGIAAAGNSRFTVKGNGIKAAGGSLGVNTDPNSTNGMIHATNDIVAFSSDKRLKENIRPIENALDKIDKLSGFVYNWNEKANKEAGYDMDKDYVGVFAQDVEKVQPEAVKIAPFDNDGTDNSKSGENYLTVQYEKLVPLLIESIKELKKEIEELKK